MPGVRAHEFLNQRPGNGQDIVLAKTIVGFSDYVIENGAELIVVHGDRIEAQAGAMVAATNYIPSAHIEGGEVSGTIDEIFRHCNCLVSVKVTASSRGDSSVSFNASLMTWPRISSGCKVRQSTARPLQPLKSTRKSGHGQKWRTGFQVLVAVATGPGANLP